MNQHATTDAPPSTSPVGGASGVPAYRVPTRSVWERLFPSVVTLPIRCGLFIDTPEGDAARQLRIADVLAGETHRYHYGTPRQRARAVRRLKRDSRHLRSERHAEVRALADRVASVESRLHRGGFRRERVRELKVVITTSAVIGAEFMFFALRSAQLEQFVNAVVFSASAVFLFAFLFSLVSFAIGFDRALWLCARDAIHVESSLGQEWQDVLSAQDAERQRAASPCDLTLKLPPHIVGEGYLYALEFSTGVVKVGQTQDPRKRIGDHRRDADAFKVAITNFWISPSHVNFRNNETGLINRCLKVSKRARLEYFHDLTFGQAVDFACELTYFTNRPTTAKEGDR